MRLILAINIDQDFLKSTISKSEFGIGTYPLGRSGADFGNEEEKEEEGTGNPALIALALA